MDAVFTFVIAAVLGVIVGIFSGLLGIGGGTLNVSIFRLLFGMSPIMSTGTSLFAIIPTSISGVITHARHHTCVPSLGIAAGIGGAITSPLGVWLATISPAWLIIVFAVAIMIWSAVQMFSKAIQLKPAKSADATTTSGTATAAATATAGTATAAETEITATESTVAAAATTAGTATQAEAATASQPGTASTTSTAPALDEPIHLTRKQLIIGGCIGLIAGVASGYVGIGGGFIMVPLMLTLVGIPMSKASGTSLFAVMILAVPGVIEQAIYGNINYLAGIAIAVGSIPGAILGAYLVQVIPERMLRFIFGGFLIVVAVILMLNEFGILY